jgi:hypothetical protein
VNRPFRRAHCFYCKRELTPPLPERGTSFTLDHVRAQADGGWRRVPCCRKCNGLKGDLLVDEWFWFIGAFPRWWKLFDTPGQVVRSVIDERVRRAHAREPQLGRTRQ